jgi:hypothetical protein
VLLAAARLPARIGDELVESAQIAFTAGTRLVAVIAAAPRWGSLPSSWPRFAESAWTPTPRPREGRAFRSR